MRPYLRHLCLVPILLAALAALAWALTGLVLDPYGNFRLLPWKVYFEDHASSPWVHAQQLRRRPYALVFGTSLSATYGQADLGEPVLNLSTSVYGYPDEVLGFLQSLDSTQVSHITRAYVSAEFFTLQPSPDGAVPAAWGSQAAFLWESFRQTRQLTLLRGLNRVLKRVQGTASNYITPEGCTVYGARQPWDPDAPVRVDPFTVDPAQAARWAQVAAWFRDHHKEAVFFNTLKAQAFWRTADFNVVRAHYRLLTQAVGPLLELGWEPRLSRQSASFRNSTHREQELLGWEAAILRDPAKRKAWMMGPAQVDAWVGKVEREAKP